MTGTEVMQQLFSPQTFISPQNASPAGPVITEDDDMEGRVNTPQFSQQQRSTQRDLIWCPRNSTAVVAHQGGNIVLYEGLDTYLPSVPSNVTTRHQHALLNKCASINTEYPTFQQVFSDEGHDQLYCPICTS